MAFEQITLWPLIGSGDGDRSRTLRFSLDGRTTPSFEVAPSDRGVEVVVVRQPGIYSLSAQVRFQHFEGDQLVSCGCAITLNSTRQAERNPIDMPPKIALARALLQPSEHEVQRAPIANLTWVGSLEAGAELRVESERPKPRLYQGVEQDFVCSFTAIRIVGIV